MGYRGCSGRRTDHRSVRSSGSHRGQKRWRGSGSLREILSAPGNTGIGAPHPDPTGRGPIARTRRTDKFESRYPTAYNVDLPQSEPEAHSSTYRSRRPRRIAAPWVASCRRGNVATRGHRRSFIPRWPGSMHSRFPQASQMPTIRLVPNYPLIRIKENWMNEPPLTSKGCSNNDKRQTTSRDRPQ